MNLQWPRYQFVVNGTTCRSVATNVPIGSRLHWAFGLTVSVSQRLYSSLSLDDASSRRW